MLRCKVHRATVTDANVDYEGSITLDIGLMEAAGLLEYEQVHVLDVDNGARLLTYVIRGERGSGEVCINGAAARLVDPGDKVIILAYDTVSEEEAQRWTPTLVFVDGNNGIVEDAGHGRNTVERLVAHS